MKRRLLVALGAGFAVLVATMGLAILGDRRAGEAQLVESKPTPALIAQGVSTGDCAACHSVAGQPSFAGGLRMVTPVGAIYSTNITPNDKHGIGRFTLTDFDRALRFGVADGHSLYPAMPFTSYYSLRPEDVAALYA
jgi:hypothetical protein